MNTKATISAALCLLPLAISNAIADTHKQDNLVVTAKAPVTEAEFAGSVTTITAEDIQLSGATNILEAIQMVPGLSVNNVSSRATGRNGVSIRGMENNHTLILIDGRRVSNTDTNVPFSDFQYNWVPLVAVERIEVVRGAMSSLYGSSALGGVINIITRSAKNEWATTVEAQLTEGDSGQGGDGQQLAFSTSGYIGEKLNLAISLEQQDSDPFLKSFAEQQSTANKEGKDYLNAIVKAGLMISESSSLEFSWVNSDDDRTQFPDEHSYDIERNQTSLTFNTKVSGFDVSAGAYQSSSDNNLISEVYVHRLEEDVATVDINGAIGSNHYLTAGLEYSKEEYHKDYPTANSHEFQDSFKSWSAFAQDRFEINDQLTLTWGARYDDHQRFGNAVSPKAHLNWEVNDQWQIKTGYSEGFKAPAVKDASDDYFFSYSYPIAFGPFGPTAFLENQFIGNSDLKEETSKTFEIGASYYSGKLSGGVTLFHSDVKDLISTNEISRVTFGPVTTSTSRYENVADAEIFGAEAEIGYQFTPNLDAEFNLSLIDHEDSNTGKWLTLRSQVEANLAVTHRMPAYGVKSRVQVKYNGKQYVDSNNSNETPASTVVDVNVRKSLGDYAYATLGIKNLFDDYAAEDDSNDGTSETGRQFMLTVGANF